MKATLLELTRMGLLNSPSAEVYQTWTRGLSDLSERDIKSGLIKARDFTGYFCLPAFRGLCKVSPEDFGLPTVDEAYREVSKLGGDRIRECSHPAIYHAFHECGAWEMDRATAQEHRKLFYYYYPVVCNRIINGENLTMPVPVAIAEKSEVPLSPEDQEAERKAASEKLDRIKQILKGQL